MTPATIRFRIVIYGLVATTISALAALALTKIFLIPHDSATIKVVLGLLITSAEAILFARRQNSRAQSRTETLRDAVSSCVFIVATTLGLGRWLEFTLTRATAASDFAQDYLAAYALRHGIEIYGLPLRALGQQLLHLEMLDNYHPPFNAILFLPFSFIPYYWAFIIWNLISLLMYVALVLLLLQSHGILTFRWLRLSALLLLWEPFVGNIFLGQLSVVLSLLTIGGFMLLQQNRDRLAGLVFALATLIKLYPGLIIFYLILERRRCCIRVFAAVVVSGFLLTMLVMGNETASYIRMVVPEQTQLYATYPINISLTSGLRTIFEPTLFSRPLVSAPVVSEITVWLISISLVAFICLFARFQDGNGWNFQEDIFSLFCIAMLLTSPITWGHNCVLLLFPLAILLRDWILQNSQSALKVSLLVLILCGTSNQGLIDAARAYFASDQLPWYFMLGSKFGMFGLVLLYCTFWQRLAANAGYVSVWQLMDSMRVRLVRSQTPQ